MQMTQNEEKEFIKKREKELKVFIDKLYARNLNKFGLNEDHVKYPESQILMQSIYLLLDIITNHKDIDFTSEVLSKLESDNVHHMVMWQFLYSSLDTMNTKENENEK